MLKANQERGAAPIREKPEQDENAKKTANREKQRTSDQEINTEINQTNGKEQERKWKKGDMTHTSSKSTAQEDY